MCDGFAAVADGRRSTPYSSSLPPSSHLEQRRMLARTVKAARGTLDRRSAQIGPPQPAPQETPMLTMEKTADYVKRWVAAFESKDLDRVLAFYTNDVIFHSPLVARLSHDPSGTVQGKAALRAYVKKGFEVFDHIKFTVLDVLRGVDSIAIHYKGITGTHVVEVLFFDKDGMVRESYVHYSSAE